jgi:hypothetical protein
LIEPPWYGPVCPVVWEGWRHEVSPYPDHRRVSPGAARPGDRLLSDPIAGVRPGGVNWSSCPISDLRHPRPDRLRQLSSLWQVMAPWRNPERDGLSAGGESQLRTRLWKPQFCSKEEFWGDSGVSEGCFGLDWRTSCRSIRQRNQTLTNFCTPHARVYARETHQRARSSNPGGTNFDEAIPEGSTYRPQRLGMFRTKGRKEVRQLC